jgi:Lipoprotein LpqB beta-propeller domain
VNESVPVDLYGIASVDLTRQVQAATPRQRQVLRLQLLDTLGLSAGAAVSLTGLEGVDVKVAGSTLDIPGVQVSSAQGQPREPGPRLGLASTAVFDPTPVVIDAKGRVARLSGSEVAPVAGAEGLSSVPGLSHPAVAADGATFAALADGRHRLLLAAKGGGASAVVSHPDLTAPSLDPQGWVWTASAAALPGGPPEIVAARLGLATPVSVQAPALLGLTPTALRISRDGSRALVLGRRDGVVVLLVLAVVRAAAGTCPVSGAAQPADPKTADPRSADRLVADQLVTDQLGAVSAGQPCGLGASPLQLMPDLRAARDAAWVDDRTVVVLGTNAGAPEATRDQPWLVELGGPVEGTVALGAVARTARTVTAAGPENLYLGADDGRVWRRVLGSWAQVTGQGVAARWPTMPG